MIFPSFSTLSSTVHMVVEKYEPPLAAHSGLEAARSDNPYTVGEVIDYWDPGNVKPEAAPRAAVVN